MKPGRKSTGDLTTIVPYAKRLPPRAPPELTPEQSAVWRDVVATLPDKWLEPAAGVALVELCRHVCRSRLIEKIITGCDHADIDELGRLLQMADRESKAVLACCRTLRLTPSTMTEPRSARRIIDRKPPIHLWNDAHYDQPPLEE